MIEGLSTADTEFLTAAWGAFQAAGGDALGPEVSLSDVTLAEDGEVAAATFGPSSLRPLGLDDGDGEFSQGDLLGRGGMGEVHVATDRTLQREVALKTLGPNPSAQTRQALLQEALFTGLVEHPNVVPVHRLGADPSGRPAMVMKRVSGTSWGDLLRDSQHPGWSALPADRLRANLEILAQVCNALHYAHSLDVLHRDVKPDNVMVGTFGEVYLLDWGLALNLARAEQDGKGIVGTLAYMAPEMLGESEKLSPRTDVYLLGSTLHKALTGQARHTGSAHYNVMLRVVKSEPIEYRDEVPQELADLCNRATDRAPGDRPESALAFRQALDRFLEHRGSVTLADGAHTRLSELRSAYANAATEAATVEVFSECRFGFQQALAIWPENRSAIAGLQECLEIVIHADLEAGRLGRAESLLAELPTPKSDLVRKLDAARELAARAPARLQELEEDIDFSLGARERAKIVALLALAAYLPVGALPFLLAPRGPLPLSYPVFLGLGLGIGFLLGALLVFGRRSLLRNKANRRLVLMIAAGWLACMQVLAAMWVYGFPLGNMFFVLGMLMTGVSMQLAVVVDRRLWLVIPFVIAGTFVNVIDPNLDPLFMHAIIGGGSLAFVTWLWWRDARDSQSQPTS